MFKFSLKPLLLKQIKLIFINLNIDDWGPLEDVPSGPLTTDEKCCSPEVPGEGAGIFVNELTGIFFGIALLVLPFTGLIGLGAIFL